jgi:hypothetical protein
MAISLAYPEETPPHGRLKLQQGRKPLANLLHVEQVRLAAVSKNLRLR